MRDKRNGFTLFECVVILGIVVVMVLLLLPALQTARGTGGRRVCTNNIKQLCLALHNYHEEHGEFPPAYTVDDTGNPLHSWRTLLLPYLEEEGLYASIDLTKPWDDPVNAAAFAFAVDCFYCPEATHAEGLTTYLAVVGTGFAFSGSEPVRFADVIDGTANTIWVIDAPPSQAVHWMVPMDADESDVMGYGPGTFAHHSKGLIVGFLDGRVEYLAPDATVEERRALLTIDGGEETNDNDH